MGQIAILVPERETEFCCLFRENNDDDEGLEPNFVVYEDDDVLFKLLVFFQLNVLL